MAAPHVAGAWAVLKQKWPTKSVDEILTALKETGISVDDTRSGGSVTDMRFVQLDNALNYYAGSETALLTVNIVGNGRVDLNPPGSVSGGNTTFSSVYTKDTAIIMTATANSNWRFDSWSGDSAPAGTGNFPLIMDVSKEVTATFIEESSAPTVTLTVNIVGNSR